MNVSFQAVLVSQSLTLLRNVAPIWLTLRSHKYNLSLPVLVLLMPPAPHTEG